MSTFAERVELLAKRLQIPHPLLERYLGVESIELSGGEIVYALACNKSSRLFFQALAVADSAVDFWACFTWKLLPSDCVANIILIWW
jgi:hypothetical protein